MYYSLYAVLVVFISGSIVSFIVEKTNLIKIEPLDKRYYIGFSFRLNKVDPALDKSEVSLSAFGIKQLVYLELFKKMFFQFKDYNQSSSKQKDTEDSIELNTVKYESKI